MGKRDKFNNVKKLVGQEGKSKNFEKRENTEFSISRDNDFKNNSKTFKNRDKFNSQNREVQKNSSKSGNGFELHHSRCDSCGVECDLPFKPTSNKPVYCRSCFRKNQNNESKTNHLRDFKSSEFGSKDRRNSFNNSKNSINSSIELEQINRKLDKIMKALKIN